MSDFAESYGIRLLGSGMRWPEFSWLIGGLFHIDSRLRRRFRPPEPVTGTEDDDT